MNAKASKRLGVLVSGALLAAVSASVLAGPVVTGVNLVSSVPANATQTQNTYTITVQTDATAVAGARAIATSKIGTTTIQKGSVTLGDLPSSAATTSTDTLVVLQSDTVNFDPGQLKWVIEGKNGPTVHLTAMASGAPGDVLQYQWRTTDGALLNVSGAQADWQLPAGPGLHFAYAEVSNGKGGYVQRRVAVNTDASGIASLPTPKITRGVPKAPAQVTSPTYVGQVVGSELYPPFHSQDLAPPNPPGWPALSTIRGASVLLTLNSGGPLTLGPFTTDQDGNFYLPSKSGPIGYYDATCAIDGVNYTSCGSSSAFLIGSPFEVPLNQLVVNPFQAITGSVVLADGSGCGTNDPLFGMDVTATATLYDGLGTQIGPTVLANRQGAFMLQPALNAATVVLRCENATPITLPAPTSSPYMMAQSVFSDSSAPVISTIQATLAGVPVGLFLPPPSGFPSDGVPSSTQFLALMGIDSRLSSCLYYKKIGAVATCDSAGNFTKPLTFTDWRRNVHIDQYAISPSPGVAPPPTYKAQYINKVDLNLARDQHSITYGPNQTAAYVCNHLGPTVLNPSQSTDQPGNPSINTVVANMVQGKNLVACVAMDYQAWPNVNGGQPLTRFLVFGPSGQLLPSVNLDGRAEKFMPGVCISCHGADHYAGHFPTDGSGLPDIGAHFLPYDPANFEFSSKAPHRLVDEEPALYGLNQNLLNAGPTAAESDLIAGWYASGNTVNQNYVPTSWSQFVLASGLPPMDLSQYHLDLFARGGCRTCHVAVAPAIYFEPARMNYGYEYTCVSGSDTFAYARAMPNALVTFNRFWTSPNVPTEPNEPALFAALEQILQGRTSTCTLP